MDNASLSSWLRLTLIPGIGGETQRKLLAVFGLPEAIFSADRSALRSVIGEKSSALLFDAENQAAVDEACAWADGEQQHIVTLSDPEAFKVGETLATTKGHVVHETDLFQLIRYEPVTEKVYARPLLLVATGTGVAPFRAMLQAMGTAGPGVAGRVAYKEYLTCTNLVFPPL